MTSNAAIRKAIFFCYRLLQTLALPVFALYLLYRAVRDRGYFSTLKERFGALRPSWKRTAPGAIWLHAVSVGEVLAALPLLKELRARAPRVPLFVSTATLAGRAAAEKQLQSAADGCFYAPFDFVWAVRRVLRCLRPSVLIVMETEIWPNLIREAKRMGCGVTIVNGRISDRALPRYRRFSPLFAPVLALCDGILAQSEEMRERYIEAAAPASIVEIGGNLKYDLAPGRLEPGSDLTRFIEAGGKRPLWIAASTSSDGRVEEELIAIAAQQKLSGWRMAIAPRQPARFERAAAMLRDSGLNWTRRSRLDNAAADVLLLDSVGELGALFEYADAVFMGGTIADKGGHNILEPALLGKPVIAGPHLENFRDIERHFEAHNALIRIAGGEELSGAILRAADDPGWGVRALAAARLQTGAARRTADAVMALHKRCYPASRLAQPKWAWLWTLSRIWKFASARDREKKRARARQLPVPVVSIGNVTTGGTGKTPVTIELLRDFHAAHPAVLTRGHGRSTSETVLLPTGDERLPVTLTGDEAQLYLREAGVPVGIDADRFVAGTQLLSAAPVRMFFLDDGFQHLQLRRDFDLVLIDALDPFGGGHLLPLGRLREPLEGLSRASAFIITRADEAVNLRAIESVLRRYNADAPIFHASTVARRWSDHEGTALDVECMSGFRSVAFCGLGNPAAFWKTLDQLDVSTLSRHDYGDHHRYTPAEIRRLAQHAKDLNAEVLLTTSKDSVNLSPEYVTAILPLKLYWLEIGIEINRRAELLKLISSYHSNLAADCR